MAIADVSGKSLEALVSLAGRNYVVTGAGAGIGRAVASRLAEAGGRVMVADLNVEAAEATVAGLAGSGHLAQRIDVTDPASVAAAADAAVEKLGGIDGWANIAGVYPVIPTLDMSDGDWNRIIGINLNGTFYGAREAARRMTAAGRPGVIVNTVSTTVHKVPAPGLAAYIAAKGGVEALTRALALEFGPSDIRVLAVGPTLTRTEGTLAQKPFLEQAMGNIGDAHELYGGRLPLGRIAVADDIARVVLFAVSDLGQMMTGGALYIDGGDLVF
ncbi:SDR family NAD(P)-dependent oxidoreductase [Martelella soudanensis]|uniref:SDR family NAD(P)-dependent oxidoreductase n=1 Tax=unclassified Martelella TaxID=2629616 RepID=UPI0015DFDD49|nr:MULTISPECIES: SDR family oxidoreductase [unclassified Martelella]